MIILGENVDHILVMRVPTIVYTQSPGCNIVADIVIVRMFPYSVRTTSVMTQHSVIHFKYNALLKPVCLK